MQIVANRPQYVNSGSCIFQMWHLCRLGCDYLYNSYRPVVFNVGEITPLGTILCDKGAILRFTRFEGRFQIPGGRFRRLEYTKILN